MRKPYEISSYEVKTELRAMSVEETKRLWEASGAGEVEEVKSLIALKANINWNNPEAVQRTAVHIASIWGHVDVVRLLLSHGPNLEIKDMFEDTPLHCAAQCTDMSTAAEVTALLINAKANLNALGDMGLTALHYACNLGYVQVVKMLLDAGADSQIKCKNGYSVKELGVRHGRADVVKAIDQFEQDTSPVVLRAAKEKAEKEADAARKEAIQKEKEIEKAERARKRANKERKAAEKGKEDAEKGREYAENARRKAECKAHCLEEEVKQKSILAKKYRVMKSARADAEEVAEIVIADMEDVRKETEEAQKETKRVKEEMEQMKQEMERLKQQHQDEIKLKVAHVPLIASYEDTPMRKWTTEHVQDWVRSMGNALAKYSTIFAENGVIGEVLLTFETGDLQDLGIPPVHAKIITTRVHARTQSELSPPSSSPPSYPCD